MSLKEQLAAYRASHPYYIHNVAICGQNCGRYATLEEAIAQAKRIGEFIAVENEFCVLVRTPVYC